MNKRVVPDRGMKPTRGFVARNSMKAPGEKVKISNPARMSQHAPEVSAPQTGTAQHRGIQEWQSKSDLQIQKTCKSRQMARCLLSLGRVDEVRCSTPPR